MSATEMAKRLGEQRDEIERLRTDYMLLSDDYRQLKSDNEKLRAENERMEYQLNWCRAGHPILGG